jgi:uncharacterized protein with ATP-grasp and redox domains
MQLEPECVGCLFNQVLRAFQLLKPDISREIILDTQRKLMAYLMNLDTEQNASPIVGKALYEFIAEALGVKDPYDSIKKKYNQLAMQFYDEAKEIIDKAEDPLFEAIIVAALGNTIDLAAEHQIDFINDIKNFSPEDLVINDYEIFKRALQRANHLLILGDNCGEIVFDKLLIVTIKKLYPDLEIIYAVRAAPTINDVTIEDAKFVGLTDLVHVIEGSDTPGIHLPTSTDEFKKHFSLKDSVILSKGQGNFESLYGMKIPDRKMFYLLKAKCSLMERIFKVKIGNLIFKMKTNNF